MPTVPPRLTLGATVATLALLTAGCGLTESTKAAPGSGASGSAGPKITIKAGDSSCTVSKTALSSGITTFSITNSGSSVTEVYVYADADRIVTEKENIGPGTSYELTVDLAQGAYQVACKPGMVGSGIRTDVTVAAGTTKTADPADTRAIDAYRAYVQQEAQSAIPLVQQLRDAIAANDRAGAQTAYAASRVPWERIEPVAESFGDLDPRMDVREADLDQGQTFSGWHRLEKALWTGEDLAPMVPVADQLLADVNELSQRVPNAALTPTGIGNGAQSLLDEVANGKITGEEETFSHLDLVDFKANLDGAQEAFTALRPLVQQSDASLATQLDTQFASVQAALVPYRSGAGYVPYDTVGQDQRRELSRVVDALSEPLSHLGAAAAGEV